MKSTRIATILYLLLHGTLFPDQATALLSSRRPISRPGINAKTATIEPADATMHFQYIGKAKIIQGEGHLISSMPLVQASIAAVQGTRTALNVLKAVELTTDPATKKPQVDALYITLQEYKEQGETIETEVWNVNEAAGTHDILKMALTTNVRPAATDFQREMTLKMPMNYVETLEQHGYNISLRREANKQEQEHHLTKRQILAFGAALLGGGFGVYNTIQIKQIRAEAIKAAGERKIIAHAVSELNGKTDKLIKKVNAIAVKAARETVKNEQFDLAEALMTSVRTLVDHMIRVMNSALGQRMDASLVQHVAWTKEITALEDLAHQKGLALIATDPSDIITLKAGYEVDWLGVLHVLIPIPLFAPAFVMDVHRMRQMPIKSKLGWMEVTTPLPYLLATRQPHSVFTAIDQATFEQCYPANDFLICPPQDRLYKPNRVTKGQHAARCLYALKRKWEEDVEKHCAMTLIQEEEDARRISTNQFAMFSTSPATVEISCKDESTHSKRVEEGLHLVTLPKNCIAETSSLYMQPTFDIEAGTEGRDDTIHFPASIRKVTNATETSLKRIKEQLEQVITHAAPTPALDWLNEHIDQIGDVTGLSTSAQASIGTGVVIISAIAAAGLYCYCARKCATKKAQRNQPPPPSNQTVLNLGYPTNSYPDLPPHYAYPGNTPSNNPNPNPPQNPHLPRTQSYLDLLKQAEEVQRQKR